MQGRILFLCSGNSGRSQIAEALARNMAGSAIEIKSAGDVRHQIHRPWATRKPKDSLHVKPGDLMQVDTLDVRPGADRVLKHFTARDVFSRWDACGGPQKGQCLHGFRLPGFTGKREFLEQRRIEKNTTICH